MNNMTDKLEITVEEIMSVIEDRLELFNSEYEGLEEDFKKLLEKQNKESNKEVVED